MKSTNRSLAMALALSFGVLGVACISRRLQQQRHGRFCWDGWKRWNRVAVPGAVVAPAAVPAVRPADHRVAAAAAAQLVARADPAALDWRFRWLDRWIIGRLGRQWRFHWRLRWHPGEAAALVVPVRRTLVRATEVVERRPVGAPVRSPSPSITSLTPPELVVSASSPKPATAAETSRRRWTGPIPLQGRRATF